MVLHKSWVSWVAVSFMLLYFVEGSTTYDHQSLDALVRDYANKQIVKPRTGVLSNISLPANFSGMEVSVVRVRSASFMSRGMNSSYFNLPPRIKPGPIVKRMTIVFENLGNWSSHYYNIPNHIMVSPVLGLMAYNSSETTLILSEKMNLTILGDPIKILFPQVEPRGKKEAPICAKFGDGGSVEFTNMTKPFVCVTQSLGHYTLVVPSMEAQNPERQRQSHNIWWVFGLGIGLIGLVLIGLVLLATVKRRRMRKLEEQSEKGVPFDTFWVGESKMPSASMIRTQPTLENNDFPY